jgi:RNA polymerase sigma factor (sigma-70 family)
VEHVTTERQLAYIDYIAEVRPALVKVARKHVMADADAEDAVQDAVHYCYNRLADYDATKASMFTWVARMVINRCYDYADKYKASHPEAEIPTGFDDLEEPPDVRRAQVRRRKEAEPSYIPDWDTKLDVAKALAGLPAREASAVKAIYMEGATWEEYMKEAKLSRMTLARILTSARKKLSYTFGGLA